MPRDTFNVVTITVSEMNDLVKAKNLKDMFRKFRAITAERGLDYSKYLGIQTKMDRYGNLIVANYELEVERV